MSKFDYAVPASGNAGGTAMLATTTALQQIKDRSGLIVFDTIADLQASTFLQEGDLVNVLGYYSKNDGAGHFRSINSYDKSGGVSDANGLIANVQPYFNDEVFMEWFGVKNDSSFDSTTNAQNAVNFPAYNISIGEGIFKWSSIEISEAKNLKGFGNKNVYDRNSAGISLSEIENLPGTWIYGVSLVDPAIKISAQSTGESGMKISGLQFYQDHSDYSNPTDYNYCISDSDGVSFWSGIEISNCMFVNSNKGINLTKTERYDIKDICGDFFKRGINLAISNDVSKIERVHIWNFSQSEDAADFKQSLDSDYAIYLDDMDEVFISEVFIYDRQFGIYANNFWGSMKGITFDTVAKCIILNDLIGFHTSISDIKISSENPIADVNAPIEITGNSGTTSSLNIDNVSCWTGGLYSFSYNSIIYLNCDTINCNINNLYAKYFLLEAINVNCNGNVNIDNVKFSNFIPNQSELKSTTVGIRNNNEDCNLYIGSVNTELLTFIYDGYYENTRFKHADSIIEEKASVDTQTVTSNVGSADDEYISKNIIIGGGTDSFSGIRILNKSKRNKKLISGKSYLFGCIYKVTDEISRITDTDDRIISMPRVGTDEFFLSPNKSVSTSKKLIVQKYTPTSTDSLQTSPFSRDFGGTIEIYGVFITKGNLLSSPSELNTESSVITTKPTNSNFYYPSGYTYEYDSPSAGGKKGSICTTSGNPGIWSDYGVIDA